MAVRKNGNKQLNIFMNTYSDLISVIVVSLALIASYFLVIRPKFNTTIQTITQNIEEQKMIFDQQSQKLSQLKANLITYNKIDQKEIARVNALLPDTYIEEKLFGELEEMITKNGYGVSSIDIKSQSASSDTTDGGSPVYSPDEISGMEGGDVSAEGAAPAAAPASGAAKVQDNGLGTIEVSMTITSIDYAGLKNLLPVFENNLRLFDITNLSFSPNDKKANLTFLTYYYQPATE